jgi:flagellar M-ring protein FliF
MLATASVQVWESEHMPHALYASPLPPDDLAQVTRRLDEANVRYTLAGDRILVAPGERQHLVQWLDQAYDLPHGLVEPSPAATGWLPGPTPDPKAELQRRIERSLRQLAFVNDCHVNLVLPDGLEQSTPSQAAVILDVRPGAHPDVQALLEEVAASVPGLTPDHVKILDQHGTRLNPTRGDRHAGEEELSAQVRQVLDIAVGPRNYALAVNVELNPESRDIESREVKPGPAAATRTEDYQGQNQQYHKRVEQGSRNAGCEILRVKIPPGGIRRLTATLVINKALTDAQMREYTQLVEDGIGADLTRGDEVHVISEPFYVDLRPTPQPPQTPTSLATAPDWVLRLAIVIGGLGAALAWFFNGRSQAKPILQPSEPVMEPDILELRRTATTTTEPRRHLEAMAQRSPREVAVCLMSTWLKPER